jgi:hypothetical protein
MLKVIWGETFGPLSCYWTNSSFVGHANADKIAAQQTNQVWSVSPQLLLLIGFVSVNNVVLPHPTAAKASPHSSLSLFHQE